MRLAWFRAVPLTPGETAGAAAPLLAELRARHDLDVYTRANAHDFVWTHVGAPYELCVFELDNTAAHAFMWAYLLHYGGVVLLTSSTLHDSRAAALVGAGRLEDYAAEFSFNEGHARRRSHAAPSLPTGRWPLLRVPLTAGRLTVVPYPGLVDTLRQEYPHARIVHAPLPAQPVDAAPAPGAGARGTVTFGVLADDRVDVATRAVARAQALGARAALAARTSAEHVLHDADVAVTLAWPPEGERQRLASAAFASGVPVIALETVWTAHWPALDPQTWRARSVGAVQPIAVTVDVRDEEHSLALAVRRLSADAALRRQLGEAARAWSQAQDSMTVALDGWQRLLQEAARLEPPPRPADWPPHLTADGTERTRTLLAEFGVTVDLFD